MKSVRQRRASGPTMPGGTGCAVTQAVARRRTTRSRIMIAAAAAIVAEPVAKVPPRTTPGLEPSSTGSPRQGGQVSAPSVASRGKITRDEPLALRSSWPRSRARILHDLAKWGELRKVTRTQSRNLGCISTVCRGVEMQPILRSQPPYVTYSRAYEKAVNHQVQLCMAASLSVSSRQPAPESPAVVSGGRQDGPAVSDGFMSTKEAGRAVATLAPPEAT